LIIIGSAKQHKAQVDQQDERNMVGYMNSCHIYIYIYPNKWGVLIELIHMQTLAMGSMTTTYLLNDGKFNNQGQGILIAREKKFNWKLVGLKIRPWNMDQT
jgi:membrane protein CcdC involved in cytochrome C biogenesis